MRENVVDCAAMNVERLAEMFHRHCRTLQVPAGTAGAERRIPSRFPIVLRRFPQHEVARLFFLVLIGIDPSSDFQFPFVEAR